MVAFHAKRTLPTPSATPRSQKIERLRAQLHEIDGPSGVGGSASGGEGEGADQGGQHLVFVEGEADVSGFRPEKFFDTVPEQVERKHNRQHKETVRRVAEAAAVEDAELEGPALIAAVKSERKARKRARAELKAKYRELDERTSRLTKLRRTADHFAAQRATLDKGRRIKVADAEEGRPAVFKWATQRKK